MSVLGRIRIPAGRTKRKLLLAVALKDDSAPDKKTSGDVYVRYAGGGNVPFSDETGYYLLLSSTAAKFDITAGGDRYKEQKLTIDTALLKPDGFFMEVSLIAKDPAPQTILKGKVMDIADNSLLTGTTVKIKSRTEACVSGADGAYTITFGNMDEDSTITLIVSMVGYKTLSKVQAVRKGATTVADIKLTKL